MWRHSLSTAISLLCLANGVFARDEASPVNPCPVQCSISGPNPLNWTYLHGKVALHRCEKPILFDTMLETSVNDNDKHITFRACTASEESEVKADVYKISPFSPGEPNKRSLDDTKSIKSTCASDMHKKSNDTSIFYQEWVPDDRSPVDGSINDTVLALKTLQKHLDYADNCKSAVMFARVRESVAGLFVGAAVDKKSAMPFVRQLADKVQTKEFYEAGRFAVSNCQTVRPSVWRVGVVADLQGNMAAVQEGLYLWKNATCLESPDYTARFRDTEIDLWSINNSLLQSNGTVHGHKSHATLHRRAECRAEMVEQGDLCDDLAKRCGTTLKEFQKFNGNMPDFCNKLKAKQHVCCNEGTLPDFRPQPDADGNCFSIDVEKDVGCWDYADAHFLTTNDIENFNKETWGFAGCGNLQPGQKICLSKGKPPMPNTIANAACGPQKPNSEPRGSKNLTDMNPCPLNVCCNVWGQCGMDKDFCTKAPADTGAPGTSKPGKNSCISNCGMDIVNNDKGPSSFSKIAYFEAWNKNRPCLNMDVTDVDTTEYTHIHFSFPDVTPDFQIDTSKLKTQFDLLKKVTGIKRIVSLGGWAFSAEGDTVHILRNAVLPANRATFADNVAKFVEDNGLDGIDFDWEYPAAPDIPDIDPTSNPNEGKDYLEFLKMVKRRLGTKSVSIATPASYWYLKQFPIKDIAKVVDYIVYMSYDLHGQWDYGNKWSSPGCPEGNCLRSHVNLTETMTALAMITKAGVPSYKVFVGIASYGRSFHMSKAGCTGPMCTYTGTRSQSDAMAGVCTDTKGYIASAEIREILWNRDHLDAKEWHDDDSDSDIVVYRDTEWVAWMDDKTKSGRVDKYRGLNFGGVSDWAVDLDKDYGDSGIGSGNSSDTSLSGGKNCPLSKVYTDLEQLANDEDVADDCKPILAINVLERILDKSLDSYDDVDNGYDKNFAAYRRVMKDAVKQAMGKFTSWHDGKYRDYFDCDVKADGTHSESWQGPCSELKDHIAVVGMNIIKLTLVDEEGFWGALEEDAGAIEDWVEFGDLKINTDPNEIAQNCPPPVGGTPQPCTPSLILSITGYPKLRDDFDIPDPKDIIKDVKSNLDEIRTGISSRFFDLVAGIWDGSNGDVLQVLSVPIFLLAQAVESMDEAKKKGGEIIKEEKEALILNIISALLFFIPFVGEIGAMAAGAATVARMIAIGGLAGNTALSIAEIVGDPSNAPMAIMSLLSAGRIRKPRDFADLGSARRQQTKAGVGKMGQTFKKQDDSLQKVVGNCRKDGDKDNDSEPNACKLNKRFLADSNLEERDVIMESHRAWIGKRANNNNNNKNCPSTVHETVTTKIETYMTTPAVTCSKKWTQACYHYSSVMSVHSNTPDMVRFTCWATSDTSKEGMATSSWGYFGHQADENMGPHAQHHWDWGYEWTNGKFCDRDEWPPRAFWGGRKTNKRNQNGEPIFEKLDGQMVRLIPRYDNRGAGQMWNGFCKKNDGYQQKLPGMTKINEKLVTTDKNKDINSQVDKQGTTTYTTSLKVTIPNAVFEIKHWEQAAAKDDGLWDNPCWPSVIQPNDPGYALLTDDDFYIRNPQYQQYTLAYADAPPKLSTSGKTRSRVYAAGRPLIAARSLHSPDAIYEKEIPQTCRGFGPQDECGVEPGDRRRRVLVDEDGEEYVELFKGDDIDFSALEYPPAPAKPTEAVDVEVEVEVATPGSAILVDLPRPT